MLTTSSLELKEKYISIWVEREGNLPNSNMTTKAIVGEIEPNQIYQIHENSILEVSNLENKKDYLEKTIINPPKHTIIKGKWNDEIKLSFSDSNILGDNGLFITNDNQTIPVAETTKENLAYYKASLHKIGDILQFETSQNLPVTIMEVGQNYVQGYIYPIGNGIYCEKHNTPHYHQPLTSDSCGHLVIGKEVEDGLQLTAFEIPFGYGIYMSPYVVHNDLFLKGKYMVVYAKALEYSTVLFRTQSNKAVVVEID